MATLTTTTQETPLEPAPVRPVPGGLRRALRISRRATWVNVRARLEYPIDFCTDVLFGIVWQTATLAFAAVLITRFSGLGHFPAGGVLLIVGMRLMSHGIFTIIFGSFAAQLSMLIEEGRFDRFFLRPMSVLTQVLLSRFQVNALGDLAVGITMCAIAISQVTVHWTVLKIAFFVLAIIGGVLVEAAVQLSFSCVILRSPGAISLGMWIEEIMATFGNYPLSILPVMLRGLFTFVLPIAFIAYLPVLVLLGITSTLGALAWMAFVSPLVGLLLFLLAKRLWNHSLGHYQSVGG